MCGIAGWLSYQGPVDAAILDRMTDRLAHRGPDDRGTYISTEKRVGLGHRRLSILDLSAAGHQPMHSADGRYVMVFNGEVYNFKRIAADLGIKTQTGTDSEVVLESFAREGVQAIQRWVGMFAVAIFDQEAQTLHLIRDRVGIKPLFYVQTSAGLLFASEIKALLEHPACPKQHDPVGLAQNFHLGMTESAHSAWAGICQVEPGQWLSFRTDTDLRRQTYWSASPSKRNESITAPEAKARLTELLAESVSLRLVSDVPLGCFLSGGIDSSTVAAVAQAQLGDQRLKTFSIGFENPKYNEADHARAVAEHLGTEHQEWVLSEREAIDQVAKLIEVYDEPFFDTSAIPTLLLSQKVRQQVTVALSGDGGDELFLGYNSHAWARRLQSNWATRKVLATTLKATGRPRMKRAARVFDAPTRNARSQHIHSQEQYLFTQREAMALLKEPATVPMTVGWWFREVGLAPEEEQAFFEFSHYLPDDLLVKVDRASMAYGLEVRVPLLDHRLVEFAHFLPLEFKRRAGVSKWLLREVLYDQVPQSLVDRPKWGFGVPLMDWLRGKLRGLIDNYLSEEAVRRVGLLDERQALAVRDKFLAGSDLHYHRVWVLLQTQRWAIERLGRS